MANIGKGFWTRWLPKSVTEKIRRVWSFKPDDPYSGVQVPPANAIQPGSKKPFRYTAPNSLPQAEIPETDDPDMTYDTGHFKRDAVRLLPRRRIVYVSPALKRDLAAGDEEAVSLLTAPADPNDKPAQPRKAIPPAVLRYDPTGLRSTMSATDEAMHESIKKYAPDHLVRASWMDEDEKILKEAKEKGLPPPPGRYHQW